MLVRKRAIYTLWVLGLLVSLLGIPSALAAPSDPFSGSTPSFDAAPEEATHYNSGDWGISERNGAATYTFPIEVPPGRNGMMPTLALRYSSHSPLIGGLAAGWTLGLPNTAVEGYHRGLRKVVKTKASFPTPEAAHTLLYLANQNITKKWTMPVHKWATILNQLAIRFSQRMPI